MKNMKDFKTTITGIILAILIAVQPLTTVEGFDIKKNWFQLVVAIGIGAFGYLTSDSGLKEQKNDTNNK